MTGNKVVPCSWQEPGSSGPMLVAGDRSWAESAVSTDAPAQLRQRWEVAADDDAVAVADPRLASSATAALTSIRARLGTAEHHLRQALHPGHGCATGWPAPAARRTVVP